MADPIKTIAAGGNPVWEYTVEHPEHGMLTFTATLPKARDLTRQQIAMDNLLAELSPDAEPRPTTMVLVASIAGLSTLVRLPVVREERVDDPDDDAVRIVQHYYDPAEETDTGFLIDTWTAFSQWRAEIIERVGELGNSSGETAGSDSSESSTATTASPSTTPA